MRKKYKKRGTLKGLKALEKHTEAEDSIALEKDLASSLIWWLDST